MASIRLISMATVQAAGNHKENTQRIDLTPWDLRLLLAEPIQKGLLFHKPEPPNDKTLDTLIHHLKTSLSLTLDFFPPLAGRLVTIKGNEGTTTTTSYFIDCNNAGGLFVHAAADGVTIADIIKPIYVPHLVNSFFPLNGVKNYEGISKPLLAVQITELMDGIFIGCTINHTVVDGTSFWHFFNSWSEISRGSDQLSRSPLFERWFPDGSKFPIHVPDHLLISKKQTDDHHDYDILDPEHNYNLQQRVFHFSKENIAKVKAKANGEIDTNNAVIISSLQAILSHIWRSVVRNKKLDPDDETTYCLAVGGRPRLQPSLPDQYFGNVVEGGLVTLKAKDLLDYQHGLGNAALQMNKIVAMHTGDEFRTFFESWIENPNVLTMSIKKSRNTFLTGSSPRFNVYCNDFGWGKPIAVRSGLGNKFDGKITVFPGVEEGSIDFEACLLFETLEAMANDAEFMDAVTIN